MAGFHTQLRQLLGFPEGCPIHFLENALGTGSFPEETKLVTEDSVKRIMLPVIMEHAEWLKDEGYDVDDPNDYFDCVWHVWQISKKGIKNIN